MARKYKDGEWVYARVTWYNVLCRVDGFVDGMYSLSILLHPIETMPERMRVQHQRNLVLGKVSRKVGDLKPTSKNLQDTMQCFLGVATVPDAKAAISVALAKFHW